MTGPLDPDAPAAGFGARAVLLVAAGGALGTLARYGITRAVPTTPGSWPWSTLTVNVVGSLLLGFVLQLVVDRWPTSEYLRPFAAVGFIGAFTTFSTVMVDADLLVRDSHAARAGAYVLVSVGLGLLAVLAGVVLARRIRRSQATRSC